MSATKDCHCRGVTLEFEPCGAGITDKSFKTGCALRSSLEIGRSRISAWRKRIAGSVPDSLDLSPYLPHRASGIRRSGESDAGKWETCEEGPLGGESFRDHCRIRRSRTLSLG